VPEIEVPTEHLHETIQEHAHGEHGGERDPWMMQVALTSALLAVLAALAALLAGHQVNEALLERIKASDQWSFFQAKGIKSAVLSTKTEFLVALGKEVKAEDTAKLAEYQAELKKIETDAREEEDASEQHLGRHNTLAGSVTLFQVAIALSAIAVLTRRRMPWLLALGLGAVGAAAFAKGIL
jgi:hypothetical protein